jgi:hypothetical protein
MVTQYEKILCIKLSLFEPALHHTILGSYGCEYKDNFFWIVVPCSLVEIKKFQRYLIRIQTSKKTPDFHLFFIEFQHALIRRGKTKKHEKREHWLDYADDTYDTTLISDTKATLRVLFLYLPLPFFWALFDQQVSMTACIWTLPCTAVSYIT